MIGFTAELSARVSGNAVLDGKRFTQTSAGSPAGIWRARPRLRASNRRRGPTKQILS
jgi:hypothetical protein